MIKRNLILFASIVFNYLNLLGQLHHSEPQAPSQYITSFLLSSFLVANEVWGLEISGLKRLWEEVQGWLEDSRKLFRAFSLEHLRRVIMEAQKWTCL